MEAAETVCPTWIKMKIEKRKQKRENRKKYKLKSENRKEKNEIFRDVEEEAKAKSQISC
jgi:hypothetical protein